MVCGALLLLAANLAWLTVGTSSFSLSVDGVRGRTSTALVVFLSGFLAVAVGVIARKRRIGLATRAGVAAVALLDIWLLVDAIRYVHRLSQAAPFVHLGIGVYVGILGTLGLLVTLFSEKLDAPAR